MKRKLFSSFAAALIITGIFLSANAQSQNENDVFERINRERLKMRLSSLAWDDGLAKVARDYSRKMAREGFFDHYDRQGRTVTDRAEAARIMNWKGIGENLFFCDEHPYFTETAVRGWMKSPTHRSNILERSWTATGIGIATARDGSIYITQVFTEP